MTTTFHAINSRISWLLSMLVVILSVQQISAQTLESAGKRPFTTALDAWGETLSLYEQQIAIGRKITEIQQQKLQDIELEAEQYRADARKNIAYYEQLLKALGAPPEEDEPEEPVAVQSKRDSLQQEKDDYLTREKLASVAIERIRMLNNINVEDQQNKRIQSFWEHRTSLLNWQTWPQIGANMFGEGREQVESNPLSMLSTLVWLLAQIVAYWLLFFLCHKFFTAHFNRLESKYTDKPVSIWYKLSTRIMNLLINVMMAVGFWLLIVWLAHTLRLPTFDMDLEQMPLVRIFFKNETIRSAYTMNIVLSVTLCYVLLRAIMAPRNTWWGLISLPRPNARLLVYRIPMLLCLALVLLHVHENMYQHQFTEATISFVITTGLLVYAYWLNAVRKRFLAQQAEAHANSEQAHEPNVHQWLHDLINRLLLLSALFIGASALLGYHNLSVRISVAVALTAVLVFIFMAVRELINILLEQFAYYLQREERPNLIAEKATDTPQETDSDQEPAPDFTVIISKITANLILILLFVATALLIWGYPVEQMQSLVGRVLKGVEVGGQVISLQKIGIGLCLLILGIAIASFLNRSVVRSEMLTKATTEGVRYSIGTILQYVFIVLSFLMAVSFMGLDLTSLGFFAGALGIGIGFGLQSIVQNFVSGLILLIQRPMEIGDWVEIGSSSGIVKRVNLMNTEVETFQRYTLILPNSDVMSATFTNRTRGDRQGRVEVAVGVAYGTDTKQVESIMMSLAKQHPMVMKYQPIYVLFNGFGDSSLNFELRCFIYDVFNGLTVSSDLHHQINEAFSEAGIEIPFPQRVLHIQSVGDPASEVVAELVPESANGAVSASTTRPDPAMEPWDGQSHAAPDDDE